MLVGGNTRCGVGGIGANTVVVGGKNVSILHIVFRTCVYCVRGMCVFLSAVAVDVVVVSSPPVVAGDELW